MVSRKHRYTLFLGYGTEAEGLLKTFEQSKCSLGFNTNILFIKFLLEFHETNSQPQNQNDAPLQNQSNIKEQISVLNSVEHIEEDGVIFSNTNSICDSDLSCPINHIDFKNDTDEKVLKSTEDQNSFCGVVEEKQEKEQHNDTKDIAVSVNMNLNKRKCCSLQQPAENKNKNCDEKSLDLDASLVISQPLKNVLNSQTRVYTQESRQNVCEDVAENIDIAIPNKIRKVEETNKDKQIFSESSEEILEKIQNCNKIKNADELKATDKITQTQEDFLKNIENIDLAVSTDSDGCRFEKQKNILSLQDIEESCDSTKGVLSEETELTNTLIPDPKSSKDGFIIPR